MPGIGGRELAKKLLALRPDISVLYLSGYTEDASSPRARSARTAFLQNLSRFRTLPRKSAKFCAPDQQPTP